MNRRYTGIKPVGRDAALTANAGIGQESCAGTAMNEAVADAKVCRQEIVSLQPAAETCRQLLTRDPGDQESFLTGSLSAQQRKLRLLDSQKWTLVH